DGVATSTVKAWVDCPTATCTGTTSTATTGRIAAPGVAPAAAAAPAAGAAAAAATPATPATTATPVTAVRETKASATCATTGGSCGSTSQSQVGDTTTAPSKRDGFAGTPAARTLTASSSAGANADCQILGCVGKGASITSGGATGDVSGVRDSQASTACTT